MPPGHPQQTPRQQSFPPAARRAGAGASDRRWLSLRIFDDSAGRASRRSAEALHSLREIDWDRFLVGLAVLSLFAEAAAGAPLVCRVDDVQWLDSASAQVLAFVARRLGSESVAMVFGSRVTTAEMAGLPKALVKGLADQHARALLGSVVRGPVDPRVRDEIVAETGGNPLALLELPQGMTAAQLAVGLWLPGTPGLPARLRGNVRPRPKDLIPLA